MANRRATRARSGDDNEGGNDVIEELEEMNKWRKVAGMIGQSLEDVCNMAQKERNELMALLPTDDDDVNEKDAPIEDLLGTDDEDDNKGKRARSLDPENEDAMEPSKKAKISDQNGNHHLLSESENSDDVMTPQKAFYAQDKQSTPARPDFSKYVAGTPSSSKLTPKTPFSPKSNIRPAGLLSPAGRLLSPKLVGRADSSDVGLRSPIIKGRLSLKKKNRRSQDMFDVEDVESDKEDDLELRLESQDSLENLEESQNLLEHETSTVVQETPDDSPIFDTNSGNQNEEDALNDDDKNTEAINRLLDADTQEVKTASEPNTAKRKLSEDFETTNQMKMTRNAVIDKISTWNNYKFDTNLLKQSVPSVEDCFGIMNMEENVENYKFKTVCTEDSLGKVSLHIEDVKKLFSAVKHIKGESDLHPRPDLVTVRSCKWEGGFGVVKHEAKQGTSGLARIKKKPGQVGLVKPHNYLSSKGRTTRGTTKEEIDEEINIEVNDSSDDFEDPKEEASAEDSDWYPGKEKANKGRTRNIMGDKSKHPSGEKTKHPSGEKTKHPSGGKTKHPSGGRTKKPSGGNRKLMSEAQLQERMEDSPLEEENVPQWLGKGVNGKGRGKGTRGRKNGDGIGRGKNSAMSEPQPNINFLDRGMKKSKLVLEPEVKSTAALNMEKEKMIHDKINNPSSSRSSGRYDPAAIARPLGGENSRRCYPPASRRPATPFTEETSRQAEDQSDDDDEIEVIAEVPSPANRRHSSSSSHEQPRHPGGGNIGRRSINAESFEKLTQLGDVSVSRVGSGSGGERRGSGGGRRGSGDAGQEIRLKEEAKQGECPICQQVFWMTELERHAAECEGEPSEPRPSRQSGKSQLCPVCLQLVQTSTFPVHVKACRQEEKERNRIR